VLAAPQLDTPTRAEYPNPVCVECGRCGTHDDDCPRRDVPLRLLPAAAPRPDLATLAESGLPGFDATLTYGLLAPAGTPRAIVDRLNKELRAALASDEVRARIIAEGGEPEPTTPEQHAAVIDREESKWSAVIRAAGIQAR